MIYFIQLDGVDDRVKIGKAHDVKRRLYELTRYPSAAWRDQAEHASGAQLAVVAECEGYSEVEACIHRMLAPHRLHGEWFDLRVPAVQAVCQMVNDHGEHVMAMLFPEALKADRMRGCTHQQLRAERDDGKCPVCDAFPILDATPSKALEYKNREAAESAKKRHDIAERFSAEREAEQLDKLIAAMEGALTERTADAGNTDGFASLDDLDAALASDGAAETIGALSTVGVPAAPSTTIADTAGILLAAFAAPTTSRDHEAEDRATLEDQILRDLEAAEEEYARRDLGEFFRQAVDAGLVHGLNRLEWAPHIDATCMHVQLLIEGQLVAMGSRKVDGVEVPYASPEMVRKQAALWRHHDALHVAAGGKSVLASDPAPWLSAPLVQNMIENICPGTLKSTIIMVIANAWVWLHCVDYQFGAASWLDKNVDRDSEATAQLVTSEWYRKRFHIEWTISPRTEAKGKWDIGYATEHGFKTHGGRLSRTMQSGFTGSHVHGAFIDDADDALQVWQEAKREMVHNKFTIAMENRSVDERTAIRFELQQRVHVQDLTGHLLSTKRWRYATADGRMGWAWLVIPLQFGYGPKEAPKQTPYLWSDWRTVKGEVMHPARFPEHVIADKITSLGDHGFATQYNQNPTPLVGGMYDRTKARWFVYEDEVPMIASLQKRPDGCLDRTMLPPMIVKRNQYGRAVCDAVLISIDCTFGSQAATASQVGLVAYGMQRERLLVLEDRTRIMGLQEQYTAIIGMICDWAPTVRKVIIETKALGDAVINEIEKALAAGEYNGKRLLGQDNRPVRVTVERSDVKSTEGKMIRARAAMPTWDGGFTYLHDGAPWIYPRRDDAGKLVDEGYFGEVVLFPFAKKNDRIDTFSQVVEWIRENGSKLRKAMMLNTL